MFPLKQQKNSTFLSIRESLRREKFYFGRFAKVYAREMQKFRSLAKVSDRKVYHLSGKLHVMKFYQRKKIVRAK